MLLIDPKGQSGILDLNSLSSGANAKVKLAHSGQLTELGKQLSLVALPAVAALREAWVAGA